MRTNGHPAPLHPVQLEEARHLYWVPGQPAPVPSITGIIDALGFGFLPRVLGGSRSGTQQVPEWLEAARARGSYVHGCAALHAVGDLDKDAVAPECAGYVQAMLDAYAMLQLRPLLAEEPLFDPVWQYAGQLDFYGWAPALVRPPGAALVEWKTGDYSGADMQLGAQANLLRANYPQLGPLQCFIVHLDASGCWASEGVQDEQGWQDFAAARRLYARLQRNGKEGK